MSNSKLLILILALFGFSHGLTQAQQSPYEQMLQAYQQLDYQSAKTIGQKITAEYTKHSLFQLVETHKILGVIFYTEGNPGEAQKQFEQALSIDDKAQLDSVYVSPKITQFFDELKQNFVESVDKNQSGSTFAPRYILVADPRPAAAMRSLIFPGWGQLYKQEKKKGYVLAGAAGISLLATGIFHFMQESAHDDYLSATNPQLIEEKYADYNRLYKWRNNAAVFTGAVWLYAFFDALIAPSRSQQFEYFSSVKIQGTASNGVMVSALFRF